MPKKGSRSLIVDKQKYRWSVSFTEDDTNWNDQGMAATLTVAIEDFENPQTMLCVRYRCGFHYGSVDERPRSVKTGQEIQVTSHEVAGYIREALEQGWNPKERNAKVLVTR